MAAALLVATGCSNGTSGAVSPTTTTAAPAAAPTTAAPAATTTTPASATTTTVAPSWRLAVSAPTGGARVGSSMTVCYEATGTSREPALQLEVTALPADSPTGAVPIRVEAAAGRGSARIPMTSVRPGTYQLQIQLLVAGLPVEGTAVTIPSVTLAPDVPPGTCP